MGVKPGNFWSWFNGLPLALDEVKDKGAVAALPTSNLPPKNDHGGLIGHRRMPLEPPRIALQILTELLPLKPVSIVLELQPIEIREEPPVHIIPSLHVQV